MFHSFDVDFCNVLYTEYEMSLTLNTYIDWGQMNVDNVTFIVSCATVNAVVFSFCHKYWSQVSLNDGGVMHLVTKHQINKMIN